MPEPPPALTESELALRTTLESSLDAAQAEFAAVDVEHRARAAEHADAMAWLRECEASLRGAEAARKAALGAKSRAETALNDLVNDPRGVRAKAAKRR